MQAVIGHRHWIGERSPTHGTFEGVRSRQEAPAIHRRWCRTSPHRTTQQSALPVGQRRRRTARSIDIQTGLRIRGGVGVTVINSRLGWVQLADRSISWRNLSLDTGRDTGFKGRRIYSGRRGKDFRCVCSSRFCEPWRRLWRLLRHNAVDISLDRGRHVRWTSICKYSVYNRFLLFTNVYSVANDNAEQSHTKQKHDKHSSWDTNMNV